MEGREQLKAYVCQFDIAWEDRHANFARVRHLLGSAGIEPGSLVVLPEMFAVGFSMNVACVAEDESRPTERFLARLAQDLNSHVIGGLVTRGPDGRGRNQAAVYAPTGAEQARYTKMHPFTFGGESEHYIAGSAPTLVSIQGFRVAPFICYDLRFPEIFRAAAAAGAELFPVIANWPQTRIGHWVTLLQARAIENQAYVIGVNRTGCDPRYTYTGRSLIVDPHGTILAESDGSETTLSATLDRDALLAYRRDFPALQDLRPDCVVPLADV